MQAMYTHVEVEPNDSCPMAANQVFKNLASPFRVSLIRLYEGEPEGRLYAVAGWSSAGAGTPADAYAVMVEDSGAGAAYLVYGGDWGIRLRPAGSSAGWGLAEPDQWGETHLVLADAADIVAAL
jgi:hypothetical protein